MLFLTGIYLVLAYWLVRRFMGYVDERLAGKVADAVVAYQNLFLQKDAIKQEKAQLEKQAAEIFILYEMTREITKKPNKEAAFEVFKNKLGENIKTKDCQLLEADSPDYEKIQASADHFIFTLRSKREKLGYLVFSGLSH